MQGSFFLFLPPGMREPGAMERPRGKGKTKTTRGYKSTHVLRTPHEPAHGTKQKHIM